MILAGALIMSAAMGPRQTFGLFIGPFSFDRGMPVTLIAFAIALHNLVWGFTQPFAGAAADRHGAAPVVVAWRRSPSRAAWPSRPWRSSGLLLVLGLGLLVGIGISCTTFGVVLTAVGRAAPPEKRSMAMGLASAGGSLGQVLLVPLSQWVTDLSGTAASLLVLARLPAGGGAARPGPRPPRRPGGAPAEPSRATPLLGGVLAQALAPSAATAC